MVYNANINTTNEEIKMKQFDKRVQAGTKVLFNGEWYKVKSVHESRKWIDLEGLVGSFQAGHIASFRNIK